VKKFIQILSATVVGMSMMVGVAAADAVSNCPTGTIENTGPDSDNSITCETTTDTRVTCVNNIYVVGENGQQASSGNSSGDGNTSGGTVVSGNATNDNGATVQVGASCGSEVATTTPVTPPAGGKGADTTTPAVTTAAPVSAKVASLPETGSNSVLNDTLTGVVVLGGTVAVSQLGVMAYRRLALK